MSEEPWQVVAAELRGEVRAMEERIMGRLDTFYARLEGRIDGLTRQHTSDVAQLTRSIGDEGYHRKGTDVAVKGLQERVDAMPKPLEQAETARLARANQLSLVRLVSLLLGAGALGGGVGAFAERLLG